MTPAAFYPSMRQCVLCHRTFTTHAPTHIRCGPCEARRRERVVELAIAAVVFGCITLLVLTLLSAIAQAPTWRFP